MNLALQATRYAPRRLAMPGDRRVHLVGVAAAEMQALAEVLVAEGWTVSGSDIAEPPRWLWTAGVRAFQGHAAEHVTRGTDLLIHSETIGPENNERRRAAEVGVRQLSYSRMLAEWMTGRVGLAVAGTHGKSTTTAMAAEILSAAGLDPTVVGSGAPLAANSGGRRGRGRYFLAEADENRRGFLRLSPHIAVILGIDADHLNGFASLEELEAAFTEFARRLPSGGVLVANSDCPVTRRVAEKARCRVVTFGLEPRAQWHAQWLHGEGGRYRFELVVDGAVVTEVSLRVPGRHHVVNALAAACLAGQVGVESGAIVAGLRRFAGLKRRLERVGFWQGAVWFDDEARHPTEIRTTLAAISEMFPSRRIWCILQPHQTSRTWRLLDEPASNVRNADRLAEADMPKEHRPEDLFEVVASSIRVGDVLLTLGAGDIRNVWNGFTGRLRPYRAAG
ncbi:MAG TPA: Mur ligase family protein [Pirellulales bacterium]|nr:Mur ligase family protein [Pirellulales bacterium]